MPLELPIEASYRKVTNLFAHIIDLYTKMYYNILATLAKNYLFQWLQKFKKITNFIYLREKKLNCTSNLQEKSNLMFFFRYCRP